LHPERHENLRLLQSGQSADSWFSSNRANYLDGEAAAEGDVRREVPVHGARADCEHPRGRVGDRARPRARVAGGADDGDPALGREEGADGDGVREVVGGLLGAEGEGEHVHAVRHRREDGREDVDVGAAGRVARLVRGHARPRRAPRGHARPVAEGGGAPDEGAARGGQRVRAVPHVVPRRGQVLLAREAAPVVGQPELRLETRAEEPRADQLAAVYTT
jgi:hypothetical protein